MTDGDKKSIKSLLIVIVDILIVILGSKIFMIGVEGGKDEPFNWILAGTFIFVLIIPISIIIYNSEMFKK